MDGTAIRRLGLGGATARLSAVLGAALGVVAVAGLAIAAATGGLRDAAPAQDPRLAAAIAATGLPLTAADICFGADHAGVVVADDGVSPPSVAAALIPDADAPGSWTLRLLTANFRFAPLDDGGAATPGEGHARVYVDGTPVARMDGPRLRIGALAPGQVVEVRLAAADHAAIVVDGSPVRSRVVVPD